MLLLLAVLFLPLSMAAASAAQGAGEAQAQAHSQALGHSAHKAAQPMPHCPDEQRGPAAKPGIAECTMICAAALPAGELKPGQPMIIRCEPARSAAAGHLDGLEPEIATPPPKRS
ncbi:MAG TPA: hypothetical protein VM308_08350 [Sphingomicrobium sp.]|nr:hypothetical protein [Sphingomicrobium sp.]